MLLIGSSINRATCALLYHRCTRRSRGFASQVRRGFEILRLWRTNGRFGERWTYRYVNEVPLRAEADPLHVNWCELTITDERDGRVLYHNAFVTNHPMTDDTVAADCGRGSHPLESRE